MQRQVERMSKTHTAGAKLNAALQQERKTSQPARPTIAAARTILKGKTQYGNQTASRDLAKIERTDYLEKMIGEVRALGDYVPVIHSEKAEAIVKRMTEEKKGHHDEAMVEYNQWFDRMYLDIKSSSDELLRTFNEAQDASTESLNKKIADLQIDEILTPLKIEDLNNERNNLMDMFEQRKVTISTFLEDLLRVERQREVAFDNNIEAHIEALIDAAFILEPEVKRLAEEWRSDVYKKSEERRVEIGTLKEILLMTEEEKLIEVVEKFQQCDIRWTVANQTKLIKDFNDELCSLKYRNPPKRVQLYTEVREAQKEIYEKRMVVLSEIYNLPIDKLSKQTISNFQDNFNDLNEDSQKIWDAKINECVEMQAKLVKSAKTKYDKLAVDLMYYDINLTEEGAVEMTEEQCLSHLEDRKNEGQALLEKIISFTDASDSRAGDVTGYIIAFLHTLGEKADNHLEYQAQEETQYEISVAEALDNFEELIANIKDEAKQGIESFRRAYETEMLEERKLSAYALLDKVVDEYGHHTENMSEIILKHKDVIQNYYDKYWSEMLASFGLFNDYARAEINAQILRDAEQDWEDHEEERKRRKGGDQEVMPEPDYPEYETFTHEPTGLTFYIKEDFEEILKGLCTTEDEKIKEAARREEEAARKLEADKKAEENRKAEEARKRAAARKGAAPVEEPQEEEKEEEEEEVVVIEYPEDCEGNICVEIEADITSDYICELINQFRDRLFGTVVANTQENQDKAWEKDEAALHGCKEEVDKKLVENRPIKALMDTTLYVERTKQIRQHNVRYDRHLKNLTQRFEANIVEFDECFGQFEKFYEEGIAEMGQLKAKMEEGKTLNEMNGFLVKMRFLFDEMQQSEDGFSAALNGNTGHGVDQIYHFNEDYLASLHLLENNGTYSQEEVDHYRERTQEEVVKIEASKTERQEKINEFSTKVSTERKDLLDKFEKEYEVAIENLAAREGLGKKYGQPKRSVMEKVVTEITKCEQAQVGINGLVEQLRANVEEYKVLLAEKEYLQMKSRDPSLAIEVRTTLLTLKTCVFHYGTHISAFIEGIKAGRNITCRDNLDAVDMPAEETAPAYLDHLGNIGIKKQVNFSAQIQEIEKQAKDECTKVYAGTKQTTLPEFMVKAIEKMYVDTENFRLKAAGNLRTSCEEVLEISDILPEVVLNSLELGFEFYCDLELDTMDSKLMISVTDHEEQKEQSKKSLRPNLANQTCKEELVQLDEKEKKRQEASKVEISNCLQNAMEVLDNCSKDFLQRLLNNSEILLVIFDEFYIKEDFIRLPGDAEIAKKRTNIKRLVRKKVSGKAAEVAGPRGYKKKWAGLPIYELTIEEPPKEEVPPEEEQPKEMSKELDSYKLERHKQTVTWRKQVFEAFSGMFATKIREFKHKCDHLIQEEDRWSQNWDNNVANLRSKH